MDFLAGALGGLFSSMPIGPINLIALDLVARGRARALAAFLAGVIGADLILAALSLWGFSLFDLSERGARALGAVSALILVFYAVSSWRSSSNPSDGPSRARASFATGFLFCLLNPLFLLFWVSYVGAFAERAGAQALPETFLPGVLAGDLLWFGGFAWVATRLVRGRGPEIHARIRRFSSAGIMVFSFGLLFVIFGKG